MKNEKKTAAPRAFNVMAKPIGALCNLNCTYCYYLEKQGLYADEKMPRMSDEVLERFIRDYIAAQEVPQVQFVWQGGEPSLLGIDFFRSEKFSNSKKNTPTARKSKTLSRRTERSSPTSGRPSSPTTVSSSA